MAIGTYNFVSLTMKIILLGLIFVLSLPAEEKTQHFVHLSFNSTFQWINDISSDLQKLLKYFEDTAIVAFFRILLAWFEVARATVFPNKLVLSLAIFH